MVDGQAPRCSAYLVLTYAEELPPVEIPYNFLVRRIASIDDHAVGLITALAPRALQQAIRQAWKPVTGTLVPIGEVPAVKCSGVLVECVYILQDVDFPMLRPIAWPKQPECWPVTEAVGRVGLFDGSCHPQLASRWGCEPTAFRLDAARSPC